MAKIKYTKNEQKAQKDNLRRFNRYLPTLVLKQHQLQVEILRVKTLQNERLEALNEIKGRVGAWVEVFGEGIEVENYIRLKSVIVDTGNVAGIDIPIFKGIEFEDISYDLFQNPLWVDQAVEELLKIYTIMMELKILQEQINLLREELRITTQRVNLFEKVKIPEAKENIRFIQIYLGDQQTAAVVRGKISKNKIKKEPVA
ncbi:MAG: V-type ATP synthase subunit D [Spirochaetes bacterium RBG_13_51_14]|nr:MAG: V-type ATP synthase subunit D [Spirochaetes bacterium RBG_13_51_14]HJX34229.1 V-type ATP synthase subunit D [Desulfatiglandales bacterium]